MNEELIIEARNKAGTYFKEGYNCAEAIFLAFREYLAPEIDPESVKMMTGFGGGAGQSGCMCGALTGSIAALGMKLGRTSNKQDRDEAYKYVQEFHDRFLDTFGATCCRVLNQAPFDSQEHLKTCLKITGNTGKLLMTYLHEKNIYSQPSEQKEETL